MNILLIDDAPQVRNDFDEYVNLPEYKSIIRLTSINNVEDGIKLLETESENFEIAIVDMRFGQDPVKGNEFIKKIDETCLRIPVIVYTNTPDAIDSNYYQWYCKDQKGVQEILEECISLGRTGLINILGHRGLLEKYLKNIFQKNLLPSIKKGNWLAYAQDDSSKTEKALLRYTLNHMQQFLDEDDENYFPEEVYIYPPVKEHVQTGEVFFCNDTKTILIVLSPACDIAIQDDGRPKSRYIQLAEIDSFEIATKKRNPGEIRKMKRNNFSLYYHYLPQTGFFEGGFINFQKIHSIKRNHLNHFSSILQVSPSFCKDIISRFSSYYARQGQPVIAESP